MKKMINLTPHPLIFMPKEGKVIYLPSRGVARAEQEEMLIGWINCLPVYKVEYGRVKNLPPEREDTIYIVSSLTAQACKGRNDIYVPAKPIRDEQGRIVAAEGLAKI